MKKVEIFTDGACKGNPGPGGWGALLRMGKHEKELSGGDPDTTNNRMEMTAAIRALAALIEPCEVELHTDSRYVIDGITKWVHGWQKRGWVNASKKPVRNADLWHELIEARRAGTISPGTGCGAILATRKTNGSTARQRRGGPDRGHERLAFVERARSLSVLRDRFDGHAAASETGRVIERRIEPSGSCHPVPARAAFAPIDARRRARSGCRSRPAPRTRRSLRPRDRGHRPAAGRARNCASPPSGARRAITRQSTTCSNRSIASATSSSSGAASHGSLRRLVMRAEPQPAGLGLEIELPVDVEHQRQIGGRLRDRRAVAQRCGARA